MATTYPWESTIFLPRTRPSSHLISPTALVLRLLVGYTVATTRALITPTHHSQSHWKHKSTTITRIVGAPGGILLFPRLSQVMASTLIQTMTFSDLSSRLAKVHAL